MVIIWLLVGVGLGIIIDQCFKDYEVKEKKD